MSVRWLPYYLILPVTLFLCVFFFYPFILIAREAFTQGDGFTLDNFRYVMDDWQFSQVVRNTFLLAIVAVTIQTAMALTMATMVNKIQKGRDTILYIWTIPLGISDLAAGIIWLAIFEQTGFLNSMLSGLGLIERPTTLLSYENPWLLFIAIALAEIWRATAIMLVILVAGIGLIPKEYYEAAEIFGASPWKRFWKVTLPLLRPSLQTALILRTIMAFEVFGVVVALGGSLFPVLMGETYEYQFALRNAGAASAMALIILTICVAFTLVIIRALRVPKGAQI